MNPIDVRDVSQPDRSAPAAVRAARMVLLLHAQAKGKPISSAPGQRLLGGLEVFEAVALTTHDMDDWSMSFGDEVGARFLVQAAETIVEQVTALSGGSSSAPAGAVSARAHPCQWACLQSDT